MILYTLFFNLFFLVYRNIVGSISFSGFLFLDQRNIICQILSVVPDIFILFIFFLFDEILLTFFIIVDYFFDFVFVLGE